MRNDSDCNDSGYDSQKDENGLEGTYPLPKERNTYIFLSSMNKTNPCSNT